MDENHLSKHSILVVDDDNVIRKLVSTILHLNGYEVIEESDGASALKAIEISTPSLILSDIMMPDMDGLELLKQLRERKETRTIPIILLTAMDQTENVVEGLKLGADDYIVKPFKQAELLARIRAKLERPPLPLDMLPRDPQTGLLSASVFRSEVEREMLRAKRSKLDGCLVYLSLTDLKTLRDRLGARVEGEIAKQVTFLFAKQMRPLDIISRYSEDKFGFLLPDTNPEQAQRMLAALSQKLADYTYTAGEECIHLTPAIGYSVFSFADSFESITDQALTALEVSVNHLDLQPEKFKSEMGSISERFKAESALKKSFWVNRFLSHLMLPAQISLTYIVGWIIPYFLYAALDRVGFDITYIAYVIVTVSLVITALLIWVEGFFALKQVDPPETPKIAYPPASAIIAAYLPNEAATIITTIESFLWIRYPAPLQIILAYNTPRDLPVEKTLKAIAKRDPRLQLLRVPNSTSKAQNINAAVAEVTGEFVGIFDADHQPDPDSFSRAWRWLAEGYDIIQGHCVIRNGKSNALARMVAVEFESIYAVSHPGRMRLYKFGIFGGSNGFWKTELLHRTRMQGSMLTEDIDSSMRVTESGAKIFSDPGLLSYELAPTTLQALWNQRMRWAQGWYQVSIKHLWTGLRSKNLTFIQKMGIFWLLGWREIYPWISLQMFPIITYWIIKFGGVQDINWLIPIFIITTLFTLSVGPGQTIFASILAAVEIRKRKGWFWYYLLVSSLLYTEFKNIIARVAQFKQLFGERMWRVTPRVSDDNSKK